jgi:hypothetical protein
MTRMRMSHNYNEVKEFNSKTFCTKCKMSTPRTRAHVCANGTGYATPATRVDLLKKASDVSLFFLAIIVQAKL